MWAAWGLDVDGWLAAVPTVPFSRPAGAGDSKLGTTCRRREIKTMYLPTLNVKKCLHPLSSSVSDRCPGQLPGTALTGLSGILGEQRTPRGAAGETRFSAIEEQGPSAGSSLSGNLHAPPAGTQ